MKWTLYQRKQCTFRRERNWKKNISYDHTSMSTERALRHRNGYISRETSLGMHQYIAVLEQRIAMQTYFWKKCSKIRLSKFYTAYCKCGTLDLFHFIAFVQFQMEVNTKSWILNLKILIWLRPLVQVSNIYSNQFCNLIDSSNAKNKKWMASVFIEFTNSRFASSGQTPNLFQ